jgi:hypothetical protein
MAGGSMKYRYLVAILAIVAASYAGTASAIDWSKWELENSVARERDWLVIRQPGKSFCYMKQSHHSDPWKMEFMVGPEGTPSILSPFYRGLKGNITYQVDKNAQGQIDAEALGDESLIDLPKAIMPQLIKGVTLKVSVEPKEQEPRTQEFSLLGFGAAMKWLKREACN